MQVSSLVEIRFSLKGSPFVMLSMDTMETFTWQIMEVVGRSIKMVPYKSFARMIQKVRQLEKKQPLPLRWVLTKDRFQNWNCF